MANVILQIPGRDHALNVSMRPSPGAPDGYEARIGERSTAVAIWPTADGQGRLAVDGRVTPYFVIREGKEIEVWLGGRTYRFTVVTARRRTGDRGTSARGTSGDIRAPMPGTILKVRVAPGDVVAANEPLVVMISMKMEMTLTAPFEARVVEVLCQEGQMSDMHAILVRLEETANGGAA